MRLVTVLMGGCGARRPVALVGGPAVDPPIWIEELTAADRDGFAALNVAAWEVPRVLAP
jgi:hypothetical protein